MDMSIGVVLLFVGLMLSGGGLLIFGFDKTQKGTRAGALTAIAGLCVLWVGVNAIGVEQQAKRELGSGGATSHERSTEELGSGGATAPERSTDCYENKSIKPVDPNSDL